MLVNGKLLRFENLQKSKYRSDMKQPLIDLFYLISSPSEHRLDASYSAVYKLKDYFTLLQHGKDANTVIFKHDCPFK